MLSGRVTANSASKPLPDGTIGFTFIGSAGQSFGAFITKGISFRLQGDANDYLGKGLSGGLIVVLPPENSRFRPEENIIIGNVALYGATGGEAYINGVAGERFCVRNSAAYAVVEGIGDHGCEYMTGGRVVVLGPTGRNFAAGMTGGIAYALDADGSFSDRFNSDMADLEIVERDSEDEIELIDLIRRHQHHTSSILAKIILMDWDNMCTKFRKITPREYAKQLVERKTRAVVHNGELARHG
jgi:glutamate synthase domain-containing protein 3